MNGKRRVVAIIGAIGGLFIAAGAFARIPWVREARDLGFSEITGCTSCHVEKGKRELSDRGEWLMEQKKLRNAQFVDLRWLKDYQPADPSEEETE